MEKQQGARHVFRTLRIPSGLLMVVLLVPTARAADRTFYEQHVAARGITIKAPRGVSAEALTVARSIVVNMLGVEPDPFAAEDIARHEFAHAIMNLGFDDGERARWPAMYAAAKRRQPFPGAFAMTDADEYWAELSQSYFGVNNEINGRRLVAERDPEAAGFLEAVYGPPIPPPGDARPAPGPTPVRVP